MDKTWDNRKTADRKQCINGRTWTRRIRWLSKGDYIKLKLEDGETYKEVITSEGMAQIIWDRFKQGQSIEDSVSILAKDVPPYLASKRASQ